MSEARYTTKIIPAQLPNPFWLLPAGALVSSAWSVFTAENGAWLQHAFIGAMWGAFGAVPVVIVAGFLLIGLHNRRTRAAWKEQGIDWYRRNFPDHVMGDAVSCRHCGAFALKPCDIAGHRDVRASACGKCGEILFYSQD